MTYEDHVFDACEDLGGHHFGGKFVSRRAIKTWMKVNRDVDCTNGVSKSALKRTLSKEGLWEKKGDSYRITKDFREKKKASKLAVAKREKAVVVSNKPVRFSFSSKVCLLSNNMCL